MSHEIEITASGAAAAMFVGQPAWHGLGTVFATPPTCDEAYAAAHLGWVVDKRPATRVNAAGVVEVIPGAFELYRPHDDAHFAFCGSKFQPYQNSQMLEYYRPMIESGAASIEAMGSLHGGRRVWMLAAVKDATADIVRGDTVKHYVLIANGHDGTLSITTGFTSVRVVCQNTLSAALNTKAAKLLKVRHTKGAQLSLEKVRESFDIARGELVSQASAFKHLATKKCDDATMVRYAREVLSPGNADTDSTVRNLQKPLDNFSGAGLGSDMPGVRGTMWGAYNAVTEYITHQAGRSADTRVESGWFGANAKMTDRALAVALEFSDKCPDAQTLGRECAQNTALASAAFSDLLGGTFTPPDNGANDFARLLNGPVAAE